MKHEDKRVLHVSCLHVSLVFFLEPSMNDTPLPALPLPPFIPRKPSRYKPRASAPPSPPPPVDGPVVLHVLRSTPSTYVFEFDRAVVASTPPGGDSNLNVNGMMAVNAGNLDDTHVVIEFGGDAPAASPWAITGTVGWISP